MLLSYRNLTGLLTGLSDTSSVSEDPARIAQTQAKLADTPAVAERALAASGLGDLTAEEVLDATEVAASSDADLLTFTVNDTDPAVAETLANAYAHAYTQYREQVDTAAITRARENLEQRLAELEGAGQEESDLYQSLADKVESLNTLETLQTQNAFVIREADDATQIEPKPVRNGLLAAALGLILGIGLAFLWETLDTRVRSAEEIGRRLRLPLLGRLPEPPRKARSANQLVTLGAPGGGQAEAFRVLRTNLEFVNLEPQAKTIMVTSAVPSEGKSTTAANLAVALARAGRRITLIDLDLRRPSMNLFFDRDREPGLTDVVLGHVQLDEALASVNLLTGTLNDDKASNGRSRASGVLELLSTGPLPPNPGEFVTTAGLEDILDEVRERANIVLIDAPPLLGVGDALHLSRRVDGLILVCRLNTLRRPMLHELQRILDACPAAKLGFVLAGAEAEEGYDYGVAGYYQYRSPSRSDASGVS